MELDVLQIGTRNLWIFNNSSTYFICPCYWPQLWAQETRTILRDRSSPTDTHPPGLRYVYGHNRPEDGPWRGSIYIQTVRRQDFHSDSEEAGLSIRLSGGRRDFNQTVRSQDFQSDSEEAGFSVRQWGGRIFIQIMRRQPFIQSVRRQDFHSDREEAGFSVNSEGRIFIQKMKRKEVHLAGYMIFFDTPTIGRTTLHRTTLGQTTIRWTTHSRTTT